LIPHEEGRSRGKNSRFCQSKENGRDSHRINKKGMERGARRPRAVGGFPPKDTFMRREGKTISGSVLYTNISTTRFSRRRKRKGKGRSSKVELIVKREGKCT